MFLFSQTMAKFAKWIGGALGWAVGGPIGAMLGFGIGSFIDGGRVQYTTGARPQTQPGDFSASLLVLSAAIMKADGKVLKSELNYVKSFFERQFGPTVAQEQMLVLRDILKKNIDVSAVCQQIRHYMDPSSRLQLLHYLFGIAQADSHVDPREIKIIERIAKELGVREADYNSIAAMFGTATNKDYDILEISPEASDEEVKKAYRKMAVKYHPDKVSHLGEEVQKAAKEKFQAVQEAYDNIKRNRGMN